MKPPVSRSHATGFTRTELLVTFATLALVAAATRPVWSNGGLSKSLLCLDNLRRLQGAWLLYTSDQRGRLPINLGISEALNPMPERAGWITGVMSWGTEHTVTNPMYLVHPSFATLAPYTGPDATLYKCPEDVYLSPQQLLRGWRERVRSYSMNHFLGYSQDFFPAYRYMRKLADFLTFAPSSAYVLLEEHPDTINDPQFLFNPDIAQWGDLPASLHEAACWFSFADGHVELRRWQSAATIRPVRYAYLPGSPLGPDDPDWTWVKERSSVPR